MENYEMIKDSLFIRPINFHRNEKALDGMVYHTVGDIALTLCAKICETENDVMSAKISRKSVEKWGVLVEKVFNEALHNTYEMAPPRIYRWEKLSYNSEYDGENFMDLLTGYEINKEAVGNCLSTTKRVNGAVAVFLPGVAERLATLLGSDFYLVFTSIHEVMIHSDKKVDPKDLAAILKATMEEATPEEDYLTSHIYHYSNETGKIACIL